MLILAFAISAVELFHSYQNHTSQIAEHSRVEVVGQVVQAKTILGWQYFTFRTSDGEENVACIMEKNDLQRERFRMVHAGKTVTASGILEGHRDHIRLHDCRIESAER